MPRKSNRPKLKLDEVQRNDLLKLTQSRTAPFRVVQRASILLKYFDGEPGIREIKRVSKPGRRVYASVGELPTIYNGLGVAIMSTSKGVMSDSQARENNVGGEVLCTVF